MDHPPGVRADIHADSKVDIARYQQPLHHIRKQHPQGGRNAALADERVRQVGLTGILPDTWVVDHGPLRNVGGAEAGQLEPLPLKQKMLRCLHNTWSIVTSERERSANVIQLMYCMKQAVTHAGG